MPTKDISQSREGRDQRSDSLAKGVADSNRRVSDFATCRETCQYAAHNDLSQQGVGEQAYEQKLAGKGKKLAVPDEISWHSDTSSGGYSSESDSEMSASMDANRPEKLVLTDKSGLQGGMDGFGGNAFSLDRQLMSFEQGVVSGIAQQEARLETNVRHAGEQLIIKGVNYLLRKRSEKRHKKREQEYIEHLTKLELERQQLQRLSLNNFNRESPSLSVDSRDLRDRNSHRIWEIDKEIEVMRASSLKTWKQNIEKFKETLAKYSDSGASTSR